MPFPKSLTDREVVKLLEKIETRRENCKTEKGAECLDDLEYILADRLEETISEFQDLDY